MNGDAHSRISLTESYIEMFPSRVDKLRSRPFSLEGEINMPIQYVGSSFRFDLWGDLPFASSSASSKKPPEPASDFNDFRNHRWSAGKLEPFAEDLARARLAYSKSDDPFNSREDMPPLMLSLTPPPNNYNNERSPWSERAELRDLDDENAAKTASSIDSDVASSPPSRPSTASTDKDSGIGSLPNLDSACEDLMMMRPDRPREGESKMERVDKEVSGSDPDPDAISAAGASSHESKCFGDAPRRKCTCGLSQRYVFTGVGSA